MSFVHGTLAFIRNTIGSILAARSAGFWLVNFLIAVVIPSPIAAPVLYARLRRARRADSGAVSQHAPA